MSGAVAAPAGLLSQLRTDLAPVPFRAALTWRIALLCALVVGTGMMFGLFEVAISCYLVIFLMKPDAVVNIATGLGLIVAVAGIVAAMAWLINALLVSPLALMLGMALASFAFLYLGAASQLGEKGGIVGLVIAFVLALVYMAPLGDAVSFALRYAWYMVAMPMLWMAGFNLALGLSPVRLLRGTLLRRLEITAEAIASGAPGRAPELAEALRTGNGALGQQALAAGLLHLVSPPRAAQIARDVRAGYRLMLAASALPDDVPAERLDALGAAIEASRAALAAGQAPPVPPVAPAGADAAERALWEALAVLAGAPEPAPVATPKVPFFFPDALTNPAYVRFALKTTAAAMICYLIYTGLDWQGIHTAMITCYVAALGTTGETVHKLGLRIGGCLIGAAMGMGSVLYIIPQMESVAALMVLVFLCLLPAAWVSTGPERIAYGGVQIGLAFLLTVLQGFGPGTSLESGWERIVGILLGNVVVYLIFTRLWPTPVERAARTVLADGLGALARIATLSPERRAGATDDAARAGAAAGRAGELLELLPLEPRRMRPTPERIESLHRLAEALPGLAASLLFDTQPRAAQAAQLGALAAQLDGDQLTQPAPASGEGSADPLDQRLADLGRAVAT